MTDVHSHLQIEKSSGLMHHNAQYENIGQNILMVSQNTERKLIPNDRPTERTKP